MPLDITFTLSDRDLEKFKAIVVKARSTASDQQGKADIEKAAYKIVDVAMNMDLPDFIADRLLQLKTLLDMMKDTEWDLSEDDRERIISAMAYFADPIDLIPDHIPGIGFLDDAMFVEIIIRELRSELSAYGEFCRFREAEDSRLRDAGKNPEEDREQWLGQKRDELHAKIAATKSSDDEDFVFHIL
ncbi:MAG: DUF1232 domain-containing protein [Gammaproteobacteria bacterium]|nr:DUF1232 domain-containing protein [Gammaproteobacteria bacterium]